MGECMNIDFFRSLKRCAALVISMPDKSKMVVSCIRFSSDRSCVCVCVYAREERERKRKSHREHQNMES